MVLNLVLIKNNIQKIFNIIFHLILIISVLFLNYIYQNDKDQKYSWIIFYFWLLLFFITTIYTIFQINKTPLKTIVSIFKEDYQYLSLLLFISVISRFFLLTIYPYVSLGDEIRDAGLTGIKIYQGNVKDFFGFGAYNGYGLFIPLISSFFVPLFNHSSLIFILPSAIVGILSIFFTFFIARIWFNRNIAFISAIFLAASIPHLHYSRTELLVILDSFLVTLILIAVDYCLKNKKGYLLLGLVTGLIMHFYAGVRGIAIITGFYLILYNIQKLIQKKEIYSLFLSILLFCFGLLIGLGPTINKINKNTFITNTGVNLVSQQQQELSLIEKISKKYKDYEKALLVYTFNSAIDNDFHLFDDHPLLYFPVNWLFIIGIILLIFNNHKFPIGIIRYLYFLILLFPLTNQLMIGAFGANHRLMSIVPVLCMISAYGLECLINKIFPKKVLFYSIIFSFIFLFWQLFIYFIYRPSDLRFENLNDKEYIFQQIVEYIRDDKDGFSYKIINNEPYNYDAWHYFEKIEFFTYPKKVEIVEKNKILEDVLSGNLKNIDAYISINEILDLKQSSKYKKEIDCLSRRLLPKYYCPITSKKNYSFYIYKIN